MNYDGIFSAHYLSKESLILWGSSGFGKSSLVRDFAQRLDYSVVEKRTCYIDPMAVVLPNKDVEKGLVTFMPADWLHALLHTKTPTILFLDEFNRPASPQTLALFTELLLDRSIDGLKISDKVLIIGACNLSEEDTGVVELPDAVMRRATHLVHAPSSAEVCAKFSTDTARRVVPGVVKSLVRSPEVPDLRLDACPRQVDAVCRLWETGMLDSDSLHIIARGRLGMEKGNILAQAIILDSQNKKKRMPSELTRKTMPDISKLEKDGETLEVISFLVSCTKSEPGLVAEYLIEYAGPETCRALVEHKFVYEVQVGNRKVDWRGPCLEKGKLSLRSKG